MKHSIHKYLRNTRSNNIKRYRFRATAARKNAKCVRQLLTEMSNEISTAGVGCHVFTRVPYLLDIYRFS